jgi:hypothetical protein
VQLTPYECWLPMPSKTSGMVIQALR